MNLLLPHIDTGGNKKDVQLTHVQHRFEVLESTYTRIFQ